MDKKVFGVFVVGTTLLLGANAYALGVTGNVTGDVNAALGGTATATAQTDVQASGTATAGSAGLQVNAGLQAEVQSGTIATSSDDAVVQLQGNTLGLIQTNDDLSAYNSLVIQARPAVKNINVQSDGSMDVTYAQPAKFLGLFQTSIAGNVNVDAQGNVKVSTPWYGFLYAKDTTPVQAAVAAAIQQSGAALGTQADASVTASTQAQLQDKAMLVNAITAAIQTEAQASATTSVSVQ
ncbi:MAG TPA: hypothetical protein VMA75_03435 [Candidatus Paceibacterota bacterium]|nr:hypothetical protein [Candidatus Paceibacterota bacterium]